MQPDEEGIINISSLPNCDEALEVSASMQRINKTDDGRPTGVLLKADIDKENKRLSGYSFTYQAGMEQSGLRDYLPLRRRPIDEIWSERKVFVYRLVWHMLTLQAGLCH